MPTHTQENKLNNKAIEETVATLSQYVADIHVLFVKTLNYHWNMEDPRFFFLHKLLDDQYNALLEDTDLVAERIRQMGRHAPASLNEFKQLSQIKEFPTPSSADEMLADLVKCYEQLILSFRSTIDRTTEQLDFGTADMLTELTRSFDKRAWLLRSHLKG
ncbi:MAG: DNA starvation/stationary phase protection protein [Parachlamydiaceae bacterium]|nr:DNA starvation/stationary phase protection protein [Parachlamydiaceae bacterium]